MLRRVSHRPSLAVIVALLSACTGSASEPSGLAKRGASTPAPAPVAAATPTPTTPVAANTPASDSSTTPAPTPATTPASTPTTTPEPAPDVAPGGLTAKPPEGTELMPVRLALKDDSVYQITTVGMVGFTSVKPSGFAREERLELDACTGADAARRCRLTHRYVHFEAEPPNGRIFAVDEQRVDKLVTRHTLLASGAREGATAVEGPKEQAESPDGQALRDAHRFLCIRFPDEPIGVGAKWKDVCHMRTGGVVDTREVIWELTAVTKDAEGRRRGEFTYLGRYTAPGEKGPRTGAVAGLLHFMIDAGEPHLLKEKITTRRDPASTFETSTTIAYQFARLVKDRKGKEIAVRSDGEPFPPEPATPTPTPTPGAAEPNMTPAPTPAPTPKK